MKILKQNSGFSLMEVMIAASLLGVVSLGVMQIIQTQTTGLKRMEVKSTEIEFINKVTMGIKTTDACRYTFVPDGTPSVSIGDEITEIKNNNNDPIYVIGGVYDAKTITINKMTLLDPDATTKVNGQGTAQLVINYTRKKIGASANPQTFEKKIAIIVRLDINGYVEECFTDKVGSIEGASKQVCEQYRKGVLTH